MLVVAPIQDSLFGFVIIANTGIGIIQEMRAKKTLDGLAVIGEARPTVRRDGGRRRDLHLRDRARRRHRTRARRQDRGGRRGRRGRRPGGRRVAADRRGRPGPQEARRQDDVGQPSWSRAAARSPRPGSAARRTRPNWPRRRSRFTLVHSELRSGISTILKYVTWMMIPTALGLVISQLVVKDNNVKDSIARTVGGIVPMIPEGLVLLTSVAFAIGVIRLGRKQCLVQELPAIEGLARVDVVCLDKTGTLTEGGMDVTELRPLNGADEAYVRKVLGALGESDPRPNASLQAIIDAYPDSEVWRCTESLPFSSARKYSGAAFSEGDGENSTWLLGAPDVLLKPGDPALAEIDTLNEQGLRVLLLARRLARTRRPGHRLRRQAHRAGRPRAAAAARRRRHPALLRGAERQGQGHLRRQRGVGRRGRRKARPARRGRHRRRPPTPHRPGRDGRRPRRQRGLRPGHPAAEARHGRRPSSPAATPSR